MMTETTHPNRPLIEQNLEYFGNEIQRLMSDYPCLREICKGLETAAYPAALFTGACFLGTLMTRCTYRFYHRPEELRRLNYGVYIIGDPGSGKSFATRLYNLLAGPIIRVSNQGMNAMNRYKRKYSERLQSEAWNSKQIMELKAFHNEEDGECFVNSLLQPAFNVYWNYVYTGTPMALETKVNQRNIGTGLATRLAAIPMPSTHFRMMTGLATRLAAIPMPSTHFRMMKRETLEEVGLEPEEDKTLRMWAERLDKEYGELPIEKLVHECYEWTARRMEDAKDDDSKVAELLCKRVAYYGINVSVPFIVMRHWDEWKQNRTLSIDDTDLYFCQLVCNIQLCCQNYFFGNYWESYFKMQEQGFNGPLQERHYSKKMKQRYRSLSNEFITSDLVYYCGVNQRNAEKIVERWKSEGYIVMKEYGIYEKVILDLM